jgi:hypothetical protein
MAAIASAPNSYSQGAIQEMLELQNFDKKSYFVLINYSVDIGG